MDRIIKNYRRFEHRYVHADYEVRKSLINNGRRAMLDGVQDQVRRIR